MIKAALLESSFEKIIERMKEGAKLKNHSQVARALDVTPQALSNYKKRGKMPASLIIKFASIYNLSVDWLLNNKDREDRLRPIPTHALSVYREPIEAAAGNTVAKEDVLSYGRDFAKALSPDEIICVGKLLKVLRKANKSTVAAMVFSIDAFAKIIEEEDKERAQKADRSGSARV